MPQPPITLTLTVLILVASGCADDPAGGGGTTGTGGADTTTSGSTTTDDGADETGAPGVCLDVLGSIGSRASAYPLSLFVTSSEYRHSLDGVVCDGESDFFVYEAPCAGYLGFELLSCGTRVEPRRATRSWSLVSERRDDYAQASSSSDSCPASP